MFDNQGRQHLYISLAKGILIPYGASHKQQDSEIPVARHFGTEEVVKKEGR